MTADMAAAPSGVAAPAGLVRVETKKGHYYTLDGRRVSGVTTLINAGLPKPNLLNWYAKSVAEFVQANPGHVDVLRQGDPAAMVKELTGVPTRVRDNAATRGTDVHKYAQQLVDGAAVDMPDAIAGYVEACVAFLDRWQLAPVLTETTVASREWQYAGTFDCVGDLPDGRRVIVDWKTGRSGIWGETALQLAAYANAEFYVDTDGLEAPVVDLGITDGMAVHLRPDGYSVHHIEISGPVFRLFQHVAHVARAAKSLRADYVSEPLPHPNWAVSEGTS
ncbi:MAG: hypothetical protein HOQ45_18490 [Nocardioidaceae bacterium]|nr:hypothetical protein [Nocardioidaceae bacterium]